MWVGKHPFAQYRPVGRQHLPEVGIMRPPLIGMAQGYTDLPTSILTNGFSVHDGSLTCPHCQRNSSAKDGYRDAHRCKQAF